MAVIVGEEVKLELTAQEGSGTPSVTVMLPDGDELAPPVSGSGPWQAAVSTSQPGRHLVTWIRGSARVVDVLDVWPSDPRAIVSVDDAADAIVKQTGSAPSAVREELPLWIAAASWVIEDITGPIVPLTRTIRRDGGRAAIVLPAMRVTVVSVAVGGVALAADAVVVDEEAGIVHAASGVFAGGRLNVEIQYGTGSALISPNVRLACLELIAYLWATSRQGARMLDSDTVLTPSGFAVPRRVSELCRASSSKAPGFA